ncbi:MAG TPA: hypothetical protein VGM56_22360, partial [Byssovorax sp.]
MNERGARTSRAIGMCAAACALAACGRVPVASPKTRGEPAAARAAARWALGEESRAFRVTHEAARDRVIADGARLELDARGFVVASAWGAAEIAEPLEGALALPDGGFVVWSHARVYVSSTFLGALERVRGLPRGESVVGARNGPWGAPLVVTEGAVLELRVASLRLVRPPVSGLADALVVGGRGVRLDALGRVAVTRDHGATWSELRGDAQGTTGLTIVGGRVVLEGRVGERVLDDLDRLAPASDLLASRRGVSARGLFEDVLTRPDDAADVGGVTPLGAAMRDGAPLGAGRAVALVNGALVSVDLASGAYVERLGPAPERGSSCGVVPVDDGAVVICRRERANGYGSIAAHVTRGGQVKVEHTFHDVGWFATDGAGALAFAGRCAELSTSPSEEAAREEPRREPGQLAVCGRRRDGTWREVDVDPAVLD